MENTMITAVGVDVSKGKSTVAIKQPGGKIIKQPFEVEHNRTQLKALSQLLQTMDGEVRVVMEHTSSYWRPVARILQEDGFYVSVVNAMLIHDFTDNSLRRVKTDKADSLKIASYALAFWDSLPRFTFEDETRTLLKNQSRLYERVQESCVELRNGLYAVLDQTFPGITDQLETSHQLADGRYKWIEFVRHYYHRDCVAKHRRDGFKTDYRKWCSKNGYHFINSRADAIYDHAKEAVASLDKNLCTKHLVVDAADSLANAYMTLFKIREEMYRLASALPEFEVVMSLYGVGKILGPQLMAEIGDVRRFKSKGALVAYAGIDAPPYQSGTYEMQSRHITKRGSSHLRRTVFLVMKVMVQHPSTQNDVYQFMMRKKAEGKHYYVYTIAGATKFLRIYYARVKEYLEVKERLNTLLGA